MPISAVSPVIRIHSWSFVYFRSDGYTMFSPASAEPSSFVERQRHDACPCRSAADVDLDLRANRGQFSRHIRHADRFLEDRRLRAAGTHAGALVAGHHPVAVAGDGAIDHLETNQLTRDAGRFLLDQPFPADEVAFVPADR